MPVGEAPSGCQRRPESPEFNKGCACCKTSSCRLLFVQRKVQGTIFLEEGETKCNETVISLGLLQQNLHFSTSAAQPWVNQTMDFLFQENIKGLLLGKNNRMYLFPFDVYEQGIHCFHDVWIRLQGVAGPPCSRIHLWLFLPSDHSYSWAFWICFTPSATAKNVLIHMELIISHLILLIIYIYYGRESPGGIIHFTISFIIPLDEWQKSHLKQNQRGYKAWPLEEKGENDSIDIGKFWIYHLTLSGTSKAWSKRMCNPSPPELNSSKNTHLFPTLPCQLR